MEKIKIEPGQIWEVITDSFFTSKRNNTFNRNLKLDRGEKIEIRFPFAWNYRTVDNHYFDSPEKMILDNCRLFRVIIPEIKSANIASLEEILRLKLFTPYKFSA